MRGRISLLLDAMLDDINNGSEPGKAAFRFHRTLVEVIVLKARSSSVKKVAFSGGVFQNSVLLDMLTERMNTNKPGAFKLLFHKQLSPNDESVSFGQLMCYTLAPVN